MSAVRGGGRARDGGLYSEVECIMGNGHMVTPVDRQTHIRENITFPQLHWRAVQMLLTAIVLNMYLVLFLGLVTLRQPLA